MPYQDTGVFPIREDPGILIFCSLNRSEACIAPLKLMLPRGRSPADMLLGIVKVIGHNLANSVIPLFLERPIDAQDIFPVFIFHRAHHLSGIPS